RSSAALESYATTALLRGCGAPDGEARAYLALRRDEHLDAFRRGARSSEAILHRARREFRRIAVAAEVAEHGAAQIGAEHFREHARGGGVREMAVARHDALLRRPGAARVELEHFL